MRNRNLLLVLFALVLTGCQQSTNISSGLPDDSFVITAQLPAIAGNPTKLTATLTPLDPRAGYHWSINGIAFDSTAVIFYTFPEPGDYEVICKAYDEDRLILVRDTMTVKVNSPTLDMQQLLKFEHVQLVVFANHYFTRVDKSGTHRDIHSNFDMWLDASNKPWAWQSGSLLHDYDFERSGAVSGTTPQQYWRSDSTEHLLVNVEGNALKKIQLARKIGYKENTDAEILEEDSEEDEVELRDMTLIFQSADSMVFQLRGQSLKDRMTYRSKSIRQGSNVSFPYVSTYDSTSWTSTPDPLARVVFK
jgi:hypothetical protein